MRDDWLKVFERPLGTVALRVYLIRGERCSVMIDTAMRGFESLVQEALAVLTDDFPPLDYIINTHAHHDHIGLNAWVRDQTQAKIVAHRWGVPWIEDPDRNYREFVFGAFPNLIADSLSLRQEVRETMGSGTPVDVAVVGGERIDLGGCHLSLIDCSGHVPGEIGLLVEEAGYLILGDALTSFDLPFFHGHLCPEAYRATLERLRDLARTDAFDTIVSIHEPPVRGKRAIEEALSRRQQALALLDETILRYLTGAPQTLADLWVAVSRDWKKQPEFRGLQTINAHLLSLCRTGRVRQHGERFALDG
ncbi:MAG: hypothetical protein C7B45_07370 [Sulfobacillus acidophilus]|uniref:Metallo-beta-lactamase domain-containing protein n=1 Tax=Sulfobacillus acidophilus TaxID=53633 RepID=A0A2T2WJA2_9FIRM|nr:MAG: hypothetical protein C7B45_07370 [Sulfobacillus acidophilus]